MTALKVQETRVASRAVQSISPETAWATPPTLQTVRSAGPWVLVTDSCANVYFLGPGSVWWLSRSKKAWEYWEGGGSPSEPPPHLNERSWSATVTSMCWNVGVPPAAW